MTSDNGMTRMGLGSVKKAEAVVAKLSGGELELLFQMFAAHPSSRTKVFTKPIFIERNDIVELNSCITRKLNTHDIKGQITSLLINYIDADVQEFSAWDEFISHHWQEPECIEELVIKWDFLVRLENYSPPQRHTLTVRISAGMKLSKLLQMFSSGNSDDFNDADILTAPAFCRIDFMNEQISKELINEVSDWFKGRKKPLLMPNAYSWFKKRRGKIAQFIHYSTLIIFCVLWASTFLWAGANLYKAEMPMQHIAVCFSPGSPC